MAHAIDPHEGRARRILRDVPRKSRSDSPGRYDLRDVTRRIASMTYATGKSGKEVAGAVDIEQSQWSRKLANSTSTFTVHELGRVADYFSRLTGRRLTGWPFLDETVSEILDSLLTARKTKP